MRLKWPTQPRKYGSCVLIEVDRHRHEQAKGDEEGNAACERDPRQVVECLGEIGGPMWLERCQQPEDRCGEKGDRGGTGYPDDAVAENRRAVSHAPHPFDDQHQNRDQRHAEPVEQDHAVAHARGVIDIERGDPLRRPLRRHGGQETREEEERRDPDDRDRRQRPENDPFPGGSIHARGMVANRLVGLPQLAKGVRSAV